MSKYIKLEDAINKMDEWFCEPYTPTKLLSDLPTIEVSEDCISRKDIMERIAVEYCKWGDDYDALQILGDIEDAPSVAQLPRGDYINKDWLKTELDKWSLEEGRKDAWDNWNKAIETLLEIIDDAPSVVPEERIEE